MIEFFVVEVPGIAPGSSLVNANYSFTGLESFSKLTKYTILF
jgi:hypothetical protein